MLVWLALTLDPHRQVTVCIYAIHCKTAIMFSVETKLTFNSAFRLEKSCRTSYNISCKYEATVFSGLIRTDFNNYVLDCLNC